VFKNFEREDLLHIIKYRNIENIEKLVEEPHKTLVKLLSEDVSSQGVGLMLESLDKNTLQAIASDLNLEYPGHEEDTAKPTKRMMAKRLHQEIEEASTPKAWFTTVVDKHLGAILVDLDIQDVGAKDKEKAARAILAEADEIGLENCLSAFSVEMLIRFAEGNELQIHGRSREKILAALMERKDMTALKRKPVKKKTKEETPSDRKPKIAKGINKVDLNSWYYRDDLSEWCKDHQLPHAGSKKELVKLILDNFEGKELPEKKKKEKKEPKEGEPVKKKRKPKGMSGSWHRSAPPSARKRKAKKKKEIGEESEGGERGEPKPIGKKPRVAPRKEDK